MHMLHGGPPVAGVGWKYFNNVSKFRLFFISILKWTKYLIELKNSYITQKINIKTATQNLKITALSSFAVSFTGLHQNCSESSFRSLLWLQKWFHSSHTCSVGLADLNSSQSSLSCTVTKVCLIYRKAVRTMCLPCGVVPHGRAVTKQSQAYVRTNRHTSAHAHCF